MDDKELKWLQETTKMLNDEKIRKEYEEMVKNRPEIAKHFASIINQRRDHK
ncbi:hypothetical protein J7E63_14375 [Bacillus sp. ISL-75]|uniref:hypothetical protein n=1 Tax=Bacillus sp. ISL-75 TaxID=2819137 RepID=UPI001BE95775|nr:hypothetical protein [Bacillus sp. ISL-75]MBT2728124.1 hypothetical protein [Bacillus sp. ISL-75]